MLPDRSPLALTLCLPAAWVGSGEADAVLEAIRSGTWKDSLQQADATWPGGVVHQVLLNTAGEESSTGRQTVLAVNRRAELVAALLQGGARAPAAPGFLGSPYHLDPRTVAWLAHAEHHPRPEEVGQAMDFVRAWVPVAWSSLSTANQWLKQRGATWGTEVEGMPLWAHAAVSASVKGLDYERERLFKDMVTFGQWGQSHVPKGEALQKEKTHVKVLLREAERLGLDKLGAEQTLYRKPSRSNFRKNPEAYQQKLEELFGWWPASTVYQHWVAILKTPWLHAAATTPLSPGWEGILATWARRWPLQESLVAVVETMAARDSIGYGPVPDQVLAHPPMPALQLQQTLAGSAVVGHDHSAVYADMVDAIKRLSGLHPCLPSWKTALMEARATYPLRPNRLNTDVLKALELECALPEPTAVRSAKPRF